MKIFNSIQELWDHCLYCPVCQNKDRQMYISVGPDEVFDLKSFKKEGSNLHLQCSFKKKQNVYTVEYDIDCNTNSFHVEVTNVEVVITEARLPLQRVKEAHFFFYIRSDCQECDCSTAHSTDLELDMLNKMVLNTKLEQESFWLLQEPDKFHVSISYDSNVMRVSRCYGLDEYDYSEDDKPIELPIVKMDVSNQSKVVNKLKTLILFS